MQPMKAMIKGVLAIAVALPLMASAQFSRWTPAMHIDGIDSYAMTVARDGSTVVAVRRDMDPLRSLDAGLTWSTFTINGVHPLGTSYGVQMAPTNPAIWYAVGANDRTLYRSTDSGQTWEKRGDAASGFWGGYVTLSADPQVIYQNKYETDPTCDFNECPITKSTIQISNDGGLHWRDLRSGNGNIVVWPSAIDPALVFYVAADGLSRSRDGGVTWTVVAPASGDTPNGAFTFDRFDPSIVYVLPYGGSADFHAFVSRDAGATWSSVPFPWGGQIIADPVQSGRAFLFTYSSGAYETRDAGKTWTFVDPGDNTSKNSPVGGVVMRGGKRFALSAWDSSLDQLDLNNGALALTSDLWWNPAQSGWGMSITHHSSTQTFIAWFAYDRDGNAVWRIIPGGQWNGRTFAGDIYQTTGPPYFGATFDTKDVVTRRVGSGQIAFDDENNATFSWQLDEGLTGNQHIVREEFGVPAQPPASDSNFADLWWNPNESGWGISISHQYDNIFAAWYVYDAKGNPLWVVMPDAKVRVDNAGAVPRATGVLYTTHGPSALLPSFDSSKVALTPVGNATLTFLSTGQMRLDYTAFGQSESKVTVRQPF